MKCPAQGCDKLVAMSEIRENMGEKAMDELEQQIMNTFINESSNMIKCKCGNIMEFIQGSIDLKQKDEDGQ